MSLDNSRFNSNMLCIPDLRPLMSEAIESADVRAEDIALVLVWSYYSCYRYFREDMTCRLTS